LGQWGLSTETLRSGVIVGIRAGPELKKRGVFQGRRTFDSVAVVYQSGLLEGIKRKDLGEKNCQIEKNKRQKQKEIRGGRARPYFDTRNLEKGGEGK